MFFFGLFSTHLPYIIIGIFYSIYLITFAFVKLNPGFEGFNPTTCEVKTITLDDIKVQKPSCQKSAFYVDFIYIKKKEKVLPIVSVTVAPNYEVRDLKLVTQCLFFKLFPNPPPVSFS